MIGARGGRGFVAVGLRWGRLLWFGGEVTRGVGGWAGGSQTYLWPSGTVVLPGDMMIDRVTPRPRGARPLSLIGPSAAPGCPAVTRPDKCERELAALVTPS